MNRTDLVGLGLFLLLLAAFAAVGLAERGGNRRRLREQRRLLIAAIVGATTLAGVTQIDLWPVSSWALMTGTPRRSIGDQVVVLELVVVDDSGREVPVDAHAVEPMAFDELRGWMRDEFFLLPLAARDSAAHWLLDRVNEARTRVRAGGSAARVGGWLGPLRSPSHSMHPRWWLTPTDVPDRDFVALRVYRAWWELDARAANPEAVRSVRVYDSGARTAP